MAVIGSPPGAFPQLTITQSQTWVPPQDGNVCIHVVGAGGGATGQNATPYGGGAGAYGKIPTLAVTTSGSYTLVVGSGGIGGANSNVYSAVSGGSSQISGTGLTGTKTAGGGGRGNNAGQGSTNGAGGTVSGSGEGWAGYTGGAGNHSGGAVGIFATGGNGTIRKTDASAGGLAMSSFGIICGGNQSYQDTQLTFTLAGQTPSLPIDAGDLCGGVGIYTDETLTKVYGGNGGIGGGGGAGRNTSSNGTYQGWGGRGGDGIILIQYLPW